MNTQQSNALRLAEQYEIEGFLQEHRFAKDFWCRQAAVELRRQHARIKELESQLSTTPAADVPAVPQGWKLVQIELLERIQESLGSYLSDQGWSQSDMNTADALGGLLAAAPQPAAAALTQEGWCDGCSPDNCCGCGPAAPAKVQPIEGVPVVPQEVNASNEWEDIRTLPTCDDLIWLYCQDSNTIDGPIAPEPNLEEYGWSHWAYANAPSTAWIDATQAKQGE